MLFGVLMNNLLHFASPGLKIESNDIIVIANIA